MATFVSSYDIFAGKRLWIRWAATRRPSWPPPATLQPGTPFIYYGEDRWVGRCEPPRRRHAAARADELDAGCRHRRFHHRPAVPPDRAQRITHNAQMQRQDPASIRSFYKAMLALRGQRPPVDRARPLRALVRRRVGAGLPAALEETAQDERTLVLINREGRLPKWRCRGCSLARNCSGCTPPAWHRSGRRGTPGRPETPQRAHGASSCRRNRCRCGGWCRPDACRPVRRLPEAAGLTTTPAHVRPIRQIMFARVA